jgi:hypothetical protein
MQPALYISLRNQALLRKQLRKPALKPPKRLLLGSHPCP